MDISKGDRPKRIWPTFQDALDFFSERAPNWRCVACGGDSITLSAGGENGFYPQITWIKFEDTFPVTTDVMRCECNNCGMIYDFGMRPIRAWLAEKGREPT